jgi:hypothetical protein
MKLSKVADTCEYAVARKILHLCGYGAGRSDDFLVVYDGRIGSALYVSTEQAEENGLTRIGTLYVDEGVQYSCLRSDGSVGVNPIWSEVCDMASVLALIVSKLNPAWKCEPSPYMGRGSSKRHYHEQYINTLEQLLSNRGSALTSFGWIED